MDWHTESRSINNARAGVPGKQTTPPAATDPALQNYLSQPDSPLFLFLERQTATTLTLTNGATDKLLYKIRDTGRSSMSSKPDYEIFRSTGGSSSELFVGSIRFGMRGIEVKFPVSGRKVSDPEKCSVALQGAGEKSLEWKSTHLGRVKDEDRTNMSEEERRKSQPTWIIVLDCSAAGAQDDKVSAVKVFDLIPNGRIEVWDSKISACAREGETSGDWNALDEMVTVAYANLEKARRVMLKQADPRGLGFGGGIGGLGASA